LCPFGKILRSRFLSFYTELLSRSFGPFLPLFLLSVSREDFPPTVFSLPSGVTHGDQPFAPGGPISFTQTLGASLTIFHSLTFRGGWDVAAFPLRNPRSLLLFLVFLRSIVPPAMSSTTPAVGPFFPPPPLSSVPISPFASEQYFPLYRQMRATPPLRSLTSVLIPSSSSSPSAPFFYSFLVLHATHRALFF